MVCIFSKFLFNALSHQVKVFTLAISYDMFCPFSAFFWFLLCFLALIRVASLMFFLCFLPFFGVCYVFAFFLPFLGFTMFFGSHKVCLLNYVIFYFLKIAT